MPNANVGDRIKLSTRSLRSEDVVEIIEVRGDNGQPPFVVRYPDGHEGLVFPGPDAVIIGPGDT
ncbi:hypothetical protein BJX64DRAFT_283912 [Aspergillus heterothallicus]